MEKLSDIAKKNVKAKYPDVFYEKNGDFYFIVVGKGRNKRELGAGFTLDRAWCSAEHSIATQDEGQEEYRKIMREKEEKEYQKVLELLKEKYDWNLTDSLTATGKKLVSDTLSALQEVRSLPSSPKKHSFFKTLYSLTIKRVVNLIIKIDSSAITDKNK